MNNYEYCTNYVASRVNTGARVLDYGCGAGQIVGLMLDRNLDAFGCDVFYEGGNYSDSVPARLKNRIQAMNGDRIPFDDNSFDFVTNNQVLEHVADLDIVLAEISRVLKPGGISLSLFPEKGVWREGHCGVPFLHWFPKGTNPRIYYAAALRDIGYFTQGKTRMQWASEFCKWLDNWTYYRSRQDILQAFRDHLSDPKQIEDDLMVTRFPATGIIPSPIRSFITRKLAHSVFVAAKPG